MNSANPQPKTALLELGGVLLLSLAAQTGSANYSVAAPDAQSRSATQQTNGRGAIGVNCKAEESGCRIQRISASGPAERAGLRVGDLLLRLNPSDSASAVEQIAKTAPGTKITLPVQRGSEHIQVPITVEDQLAFALRGAALDDTEAEVTVGNIYRSGLGVPKNALEAVNWYRKAAEQGYREAQVAMGWMYEHGEGVVKDDQLAFTWYRKAAEQGHAPAQYAVGQMYSEGRGVTKDDKAAAEWFRKGAEQGNPLAESNLAWCYENGRGVPRDLANAIAWYKKAADQGFQPAKEQLARLHP